MPQHFNSETWHPMKTSRVGIRIFILSLYLVFYSMFLPDGAPAQTSQARGKVEPLEVPEPSWRKPKASTKEDEARGFYIQRPRVGLGVIYDFDEERRESGSSSSKDITQELRERLLLETRGWVYHPALMTFKLRLEPEWRQIDEDRDRTGTDVTAAPPDEGREDAFLGAYDANVHLLQYKPYSLRLYGQRRETTLRSAFAQSSDSEIDTYGADLYLKPKQLPTTIGYSHREVDQTGFFSSDETRDEFRLLTRHIANRSQTRLNANYTESERTSQGILNAIETLNADLHNHWEILDKRRLRLNSFWNYRSTQSDTIDTTDWRIAENLHWRHRTNLYSDYNANFGRLETNDFEQENQSYSARVTHLYKDQLTTTLEGGYTGNSFTGGDDQTYRTRLDLSYRRPTQWGRLNLFAGWGYNITQRDADDLDRQVLDESRILSNTGPVQFLANEDVDLASVVVTDNTNTTVFALGADYTLTLVGQQVRIDRTTFGAIADGQEVFVDYVFTADEPFDDTLLRQSYGIEMLFGSALTLSYRYQQDTQDITSGPEPDNPVDDTLHHASARYVLPWSETRLDYEDSDRTSGISTSQWRISETLRSRWNNRLFGSITGTYVNTEFKELDETEDIFDLRARMEWVPRSWSKYTLEAFREDVNGDVRDTVDTGVLFRLDLAYRIWRGAIIYSLFDEEDRMSDNSRLRQTFRVEVIRIPW